jgi:hypothetical protein
MYSRQQESITSQFHSRLEAVFNHIWKIVLVFWPLIHFVFCPGSFRACCILWGVPVVEDGVDTYRCLFLISQSQYCHIGYSLIDICSISVLFLPNCIVKPFIGFTPSVSGTTLSVPSVYFISICIYFINVPHVYILSCYACFICK